MNNYSTETKKRFCKDFDIPIKIFSEPYWSYLTNLYENYFGLSDKFALLDEEISKCNSEQEFLDKMFHLRDDIITKTKETDVYKHFLEMDMNKYGVKTKYSSKHIYNNQNIGQVFISIDLVKANFQALKYIDKELVFGSKTYGEYLGRFTDSKYLKESKRLRQVIFGNMNPKRQVTVEKFLMKQVLDLLERKYELGTIVSFSNDEIIYQADDFVAEYLTNFLPENIKNIVKTNLGLDVRVEIFKLCKIENSDFYFKENVNTNNYKLMCVSSNYFPQAYKKYNGLEIIDMDLAFWYENQLCKFINPLF